MTDIRSLIEEIKSNRMRLPEMQREYVWKSTQVRDLLDSLYRKYPVGTILRWETTQKIPTRDFAVSQENTKYESYYLLLDGQQRLTSLKAILCGEPVTVRGRKRAIDIYFNLEHPDTLEETKVATDDDNETEFEDDDNIKLTSDEEENKSRLTDMKRRVFVVENPLVKNQNNWISVAGVFANKVDEQDIIERAGDIKTPEGEQRLKKYMRRFNALKNIENYDFQVKTLPASMTYEEVTEIFVRVNSAGTKLKGSDLALAQITAKWPTSEIDGITHDGALVKFNKEKENCEKHGWDLSTGIIVRTLVAIMTSQSKFRMVSSLSKNELEIAWPKVTKALEHTLDELKNTFGLETDATLSSPYFIVALSFLYHTKNNVLSETEANTIKKWFLIANAKGRYSRGSSETYLDQDLTTIKDNNLQGLLDNLKMQFGRLDFQTIDFENKNTASGIFKTMFTVMRHNGALDWNTPQIISMNNVANRNQIEFHHIFPQDFLKGRYERDEINDIANQTFIVKRTNVLIKNDDPAVYLPEVLQKKGEENFRKHCIPTDQSLWNIDKYPEFIAERRQLLTNMMNDYLNELD